MVKQAAGSKEVTKDTCELKEFMWLIALIGSKFTALFCIINSNATGNYSPVACIELKLLGNTFTDCMFSMTHWWLRWRKCFVKFSCNNTLCIIWANPEATHWCWKLNKICKFFFFGIIDDLQSVITCLKCVSHKFLFLFLEGLFLFWDRKSTVIFAWYRFNHVREKYYFWRFLLVCYRSYFLKGGKQEVRFSSNNNETR